MDIIEVKRTSDGSVRGFSETEIKDGTLLDWVTENDESADGLVRFLNQAQEEGNALAPSLDNFPKIVEDGSLTTNQNGDVAVKWGGNDGYEKRFNTVSNISTSSVQTSRFTVDVESISDEKDTLIADSDGVRIREKGGSINALIYNPDTNWQQLSGAPANVHGFQSYKGSMYLEGGTSIYKFDEETNSFNSTLPNRSIQVNVNSSLVKYNNKLWTYDAGTDKSLIYSFTGPKLYEGYFFRSDGQKLYIIDNFPSDTVIEEHSLNTAWDVTSAVLDSKFTFANDELKDIHFRPDGSSFYAVSSNETAYQFKLTTNWSVESASLETSKNLNSNSSWGLAISPDGQKLFVVDKEESYNNSFVDQYNFGTAWNLSSTSLNQTTEITAQYEDTNAKYITFEDNGSKMYLSGLNIAEGVYRSTVIEFDLGTPFDITTKSKNGFYVLSVKEIFGGREEEEKVRKVFFKDKNTFFVSGFNGDLYEYSLYEDWNIESGNFNQQFTVDPENSGWSPEYVSGRVSGSFMRDDGKKFFITNKDSGVVTQYDLETAWDISTATKKGRMSAQGRETDLQAVYIRNDGKRMYLVGGTNDRLLEYELGNPWDLKTSIFRRSYDASKNDNLSAWPDEPTGMHFKDDGSFVYFLANEREITEWSLSTPWDVTTLSKTGKTYSIAGTASGDEPESTLSQPEGIDFSKNGSKLFLIGQNGTQIAYDLNTAWDISTLSVNSSLDGDNRGVPVGHPPNDSARAEGVVVSPDGKNYIVSANATTYQFHLANEYSILSRQFRNKKTFEVSEMEITCYIPYKNDLIIIYRGGETFYGTGGIIKYDGNDWNEDFLTSHDVFQITGENVHPSGIDAEWYGGGVWKNDLYVPLSSTGEDSDTGDRVMKYNPNEGWSVWFKFGLESGTNPEFGFSTAIPYQGDLYLINKTIPNEMIGNEQVFVYDENKEKFVQSFAIEGLWYMGSSTLYDEDLYLAHWFSWSYDGSIDGVYKYDGESVELDLQTDGGPWKGIGRHKGELWTSHKYVDGEVYRKGNGTELSLPYDENKKEIDVAVSVSENFWGLSVDEKNTVKSHNIDFKNTGNFRLSLSYGASDSDQIGPVDENLTGFVKKGEYFSEWVSPLKEPIFDKGSTSINIFYTTTTNIQGKASYTPFLGADKYQIFSSKNQTGPFDNKVKEVSDPPKQISWDHQNLSSNQKFYYKLVVIGPNDKSRESNVVSATSEFMQPSPPSLQISTQSKSSISGSISSEDPSEFYDKFEIYRSTTSGGPYNKIIEIFDPSKTETWTDSNVSQSTEYYYVGRAVQTAASPDLSSNNSSEVSAAAANSLNISEGETETLSNTTETFFNVTINGTLNIEDKVTFNIANEFNVGSTGEINGVGNGFQPGSGEWADGNGPGSGTGLDGDGGNGAGYGGRGGAGGDRDHPAGSIYGDADDSTQIKQGSAGGNGDPGIVGGAGGAALRVIPDDTASIDFILNGTINVSGENGDDETGGGHGAGGGSGGGVLIEALVQGSGSILAAGGDGGADANDGGGGGGGGRIKTFGLESIDTDISGGTAPEPQDSDETPGKDGTVRTFPSQTLHMSIDSQSGSSISGTISTNLTVDKFEIYRATSSGGSFSKISEITGASQTESWNDGTVQSNTEYFYKVKALNTSASPTKDYGFSREVSAGARSDVLRVPKGASQTLTGSSESYYNVKVLGTLTIEDKVDMNVSNKIYLDEIGKVDGFGNGFQPNSGEFVDGNGPGAGLGQDADAGTGASYGGQGGSAPDAFDTPPLPYGSSDSRAIQQGSSGGNGDEGSQGGAGGAAIEIFTTSSSFEAELNGILNFNGENGDDKTTGFRASGGGSGGGIFVETDVTGNGIITAKGGNGGVPDNDAGGGGGGGRIKAESIAIRTDVSGGTAIGEGEGGDAGTVHEFNP